MFDFEGKLSRALSYCGKDSETVASAICERFFDFYSLAQTDVTVVNAICPEKYSTMIRVMAALSGRRITDQFKFGKPHSEKEIFDFLSAYYFDIVNETVLILPLDKQDRIISADVIVEGTVNFSGVLTRRLLEIMIKRGAKSAILVHNHPAGTATPSSEDIETTKMVSELLLASDMRLVCHYIVAGKEITRLDGEYADKV